MRVSTRRTSVKGIRRSISAFALTMAAVLGAPVSAAEMDGARDCHRLYRMTDLSYAVEPGVRVEESDGVPAHCRLRGVVNRAIRVEVTMPDDWNGRMMFTAAGGNAGVLVETRSLLSRGFAMATTDTGHEGQLSTFMRQPEALIDYAYRGIHLATVFVKEAIARYYGQGVDHAYLRGCSNGGRAALLEALRFPDDYDGILAGAPAFRYQEFFPWTLHAHRAQEANPLTQESLQILGAASRAACDSLDGVEDGVINDPRQCTSAEFDLTKLACRAGRTDGCLTAGQIETARTMYAGLVDENGVVLSRGVVPGAEDDGDWPIWVVGGTEYNAALGLAPGPLNALVLETFKDLLHRDASFDLDTFDPVADRGKLDDAAAFMDVDSADLREYESRGGKLLMYQGWNDYPLRPERAIDYLLEVEAAHAGRGKTRDFFRLFMVPGMGHCAGGPGAWVTDYVDPLVEWVEEGRAPERIVGTRPDSSFARPQCVYPKLARYAGGPQNAASSFSCE